MLSTRPDHLGALPQAHNSAPWMPLLNAAKVSLKHTRAYATARVTQYELEQHMIELLSTPIVTFKLSQCVKSI